MYTLFFHKYAYFIGKEFNLCFSSLFRERKTPNSLEMKDYHIECSRLKNVFERYMGSLMVCKSMFQNEGRKKTPFLSMLL